MKNMVKIIVILLVIALVGALVWMIFFNKDKNIEQLDNDTALVIAKEKYEEMLNYAKANNMELSSNPESIEYYQFEDESYLKIENYKEIIEKDISNEFKEKFNNIAQIIEKNGDYYINVKSIEREKNLTYDSTQLLITNVSKDEIICEAQSTYKNYTDNSTSTVSRKFVLKRENKVWKIVEFELPY